MWIYEPSVQNDVSISAEGAIAVRNFFSKTNKSSEVLFRIVIHHKNNGETFFNCVTVKEIIWERWNLRLITSTEETFQVNSIAKFL